MKFNNLSKLLPKGALFFCLLTIGLTQTPDASAQPEMVPLFDSYSSFVEYVVVKARAGEREKIWSFLNSPELRSIWAHLPYVESYMLKGSIQNLVNFVISENTVQKLKAEMVFRSIFQTFKVLVPKPKPGKVASRLSSLPSNFVLANDDPFAMNRRKQTYLVNSNNIETVQNHASIKAFGWFGFSAMILYDVIVGLMAAQGAVTDLQSLVWIGGLGTVGFLWLAETADNELARYEVSYSQRQNHTVLNISPYFPLNKLFVSTPEPVVAPRVVTDAFMEKELQTLAFFLDSPATEMDEESFTICQFLTALR